MASAIPFARISANALMSACGRSKYGSSVRQLTYGIFEKPITVSIRIPMYG
jgi:hypothetical protein